MIATGDSNCELSTRVKVWFEDLDDEDDLEDTTSIKGMILSDSVSFMIPSSFYPQGCIGNHGVTDMPQHLSLSGADNNNHILSA